MVHAPIRDALVPGVVKDKIEGNTILNIVCVHYVDTPVQDDEGALITFSHSNFAYTLPKLGPQTLLSLAWDSSLYT